MPRDGVERNQREEPPYRGEAPRLGLVWIKECMHPTLS